jgi:hypothetical protein
MSLVFTLSGHPKAKKAYGWSHADGKDNKGERFVTVLELPPVDSPQTAVKVAIAAEVRGKKRTISDLLFNRLWTPRHKPQPVEHAIIISSYLDMMNCNSDSGGRLRNSS